MYHHLDSVRISGGESITHYNRRPISRKKPRITTLINSERTFFALCIQYKWLLSQKIRKYASAVLSLLGNISSFLFKDFEKNEDKYYNILIKVKQSDLDGDVQNNEIVFNLSFCWNSDLSGKAFTNNEIFMWHGLCAWKLECGWEAEVYPGGQERHALVLEKQVTKWWPQVTEKKISCLLLDLLLNIVNQNSLWLTLTAMRREITIFKFICTIHYFTYPLKF